MTDADVIAARTLKIIGSTFNLVELPERYADHYRHAGPRTAYTIRDGALRPVMYLDKSAADFRTCATNWEASHSRIILGDGGGRVDPFVDAGGVVIGHIGWFPSFSIYVPTSTKLEITTSLSEVLARGGVYADAGPIGPAREGWINDVIQDGASRARLAGLSVPHKVFGRPQTIYRLIVNPTGFVVASAVSRGTDGIEPSAFDPLDLIAIPELIYVAGKAAAKKIIYAIAKRRLARAAARGAAYEIANAVPAERGQSRGLVRLDGVPRTSRAMIQTLSFRR